MTSRIAFPPCATIREVSRFYRCSERQVYRKIDAGEIEVVDPKRRANGRRVLVQSASLFRNTGTTPTPEVVAWVWGDGEGPAE